MEATIIEASAKRVKPDQFKPDYGTAGFRAKASLLSSTVFRCGILMALRTLNTKKTTGICITASHNPAPDNGVKLVEPSGEMLMQRYEKLANDLSNADSSEELVDIVKNALQEENIDLDPKEGKVLIAYDTRPSGESLAADAAAGVECLGVPVEMLNVLTTPQLHWAVMRTNQNLDPSEAAYYALLSDAFSTLVNSSYKKQLHIDCANGVGALKLAKLAPLLKPFGLEMVLYNVGGGILNHDCGSDHVQKQQVLPSEMESIGSTDFCCSVDGDADRLVYFYAEGEGSKKIKLLDGDKIASLVAGLLKDLVGKLPSSAPSATIGVVQTAYANGSSTKYLDEVVKCNVVITPTGVKHLHEAAHAFDVGIYFEANGHGTVLFKKEFIKYLKEIESECHAAKELLAVSRVINEAVGDAISDILLVEAAMFKRGLKSLTEWNEMYVDMPSKQIKVAVKDRSAIVTTDAERKIAKPEGLQAQIDDLVARYPGSRTFVRPSGTEDVVRIYAEATTVHDVEGLAQHVEELVVGNLS